MKLNNLFFAFGLAALLPLVGCTKKTPEEKKAEIRQDAATEIVDNNKDIADANKDVADQQKDVAAAKEDVVEARNDAAKENADVRAEAAKDLSAVDKKAFTENVEKRLDAVKDGLDKLDGQVDGNKAANNPELTQAVATAKGDLKTAQTSFESMKDVDDTKWSALRPGVEQDVAKAESSYQKVTTIAQAH